MVDQPLEGDVLYDWQKPKKPYQFGRVISRAFSGVFRNWRPILLAVGLIMIIGLVVSLPTYFMDQSDPAAFASNPLVLMATIVSSILSFVFMMFICVFTDIVAFKHFTKQNIVFVDALKRGTKASLPILFICILYYIASYIGFLLLIVPGVLISLGWAIIGPIYLHEDVPLFGTFARSWELTRGYKGWIWLGMFVMNLILIAAFAIPIALLAPLYGTLLSDTDLGLQPKGLSVTLGSLFSLVLYFVLALYASFICAIYTELREIREGLLSEEIAAVFD